MQIYELSSDFNRYESFVLSDERDAGAMIDGFRGETMVDVWKPVSIELSAEDNSHEMPSSDFPLLHAVVPVFSRRAVEALRDLLEPNGELLPLASGEGEYFAFNITRIVDALDEANSKVKRFSSGRVMIVEQHEFLIERVVGLTVFKIPQLARSHEFVTDAFVERVNQRRLTGFDFVPVWSSIAVAA